ncbi:MAG TPA: hypothetical protein VFE59_05190 [Trebonia sp.]|nr:hypothetical protein [Trebonia sp.]
MARQNAMSKPVARCHAEVCGPARAKGTVDDLFLPLVAAYRGTVRSGA